jgi:hypothetical protein
MLSETNRIDARISEKKLIAIPANGGLEGDERIYMRGRRSHID